MLGRPEPRTAGSRGVGPLGHREGKGLAAPKAFFHRFLPPLLTAALGTQHKEATVFGPHLHVVSAVSPECVLGEERVLVHLLRNPTNMSAFRPGCGAFLRDTDVHEVPLEG